MKTEDDASARTPRILVVDDRAQVREFIIFMLHPGSFETDEAAHGRTALKKLEENHYDLMMVHLGLREMRGETLIETVREAGMKLPILAYSARIPDEIRSPSRQTLFDEFLPQPLEPVELLKTILVLLCRKSEGSLLGIDLSGADLSGADLNRADLSDVNLRGANLSGADLRETNLSGADLNGTDLSGANLRGTKIDDTAQIDYKWRQVWGIVNQGAEKRNLSKADLSGADLNGANLRRADLSGADLSGADLDYADLREANLSEANLSRAALSRANLFGADLFGADLSNATYTDDTIWPDDEPPPEARNLLGWRRSPWFRKAKSG